MSSGKLTAHLCAVLEPSQSSRLTEQRYLEASVWDGGFVEFWRCALGLAFALEFAQAGVNKLEVTSFRLLVSEGSGTRGGSSPALSPDGRTLAFFGEDCSGVWILHGSKLLDGSV